TSSRHARAFRDWSCSGTWVARRPINVVADADEDQSSPFLRHPEVGRVKYLVRRATSGSKAVAGFIEFGHETTEDRLVSSSLHTRHVFHHEDLRAQRHD